MKTRSVAFVGMGGVGGFFGTLFNEAHKSQHRISFVARGAAFEQIKSRGFVLESEFFGKITTFPHQVVDKIRDLATPDLVFICVKSYDLEQVCRDLEQVITPETVIIPLMNGADIYQRITKILPHQVVLPACVFVFSHIQGAGVVSHKGKAGSLIYGRDSQKKDKDVDWIEKMISVCGFPYQFRDNAMPAIWKKFIFIASFGLVTALYNKGMTAAYNETEQKNRVRNIMNEIKTIALNLEIDLGEDIVNTAFERAHNVPLNTPTSLQLDVNSDKQKNELDLFGGTIVRMGERLKVPTPETIAVLEEINQKRNN